MLRHRFSAHFANDSTVIHHQCAVADADNFLRFGGKHDYRDSLLRQLENDVVDFFLCAYVNALRRVIQNEYLRLTAQPLCQHDLLLVAAGQAGDRVALFAHLDMQRGFFLFKLSPLPHMIEQTMAHQLAP